MSRGDDAHRAKLPPFSALTLSHGLAPAGSTVVTVHEVQSTPTAVAISSPRAATGDVSIRTKRFATVSSLSRGNGEGPNSGRLNPFNHLSAASLGALVGGGFVPLVGEGWARAEKQPPASGTPSGNEVAKKPGQKSVLILMSDTGGGHRASAEALKAGFQELYGSKYEVHVVDVWSKWMGWPTNQYPKSYSFMVRNPWLWRFNYEVSRPAIVHQTMFGLTELMGNARGVGRCIDRYDPDLVVSVHPLLQNLPLRALARRARRTGSDKLPFSTVVTDFTTCHECWFNKGVDQCFVATEEAKAVGLRRKLREEQMTLHGLPIRPAFSKALPPKDKLRASLGMDRNKPAVLLVGGGEGMGPVEATCKALAEKMGSSGQVVVICGRNQKLVQRLSSMAWPFKIIVNGFVTNMSDWMGACDCIVTKAGPGTIAEAMIRGLPIVLNGCVPCQEEGNIPWVLENKVGAYSTDPPVIAGIVAEWFTSKAGELRAMAERAKKLGRPDATFKIVEDLDLICSRAAWKRAAKAKAAMAAAM